MMNALNPSASRYTGGPRLHEADAMTLSVQIWAVVLALMAFGVLMVFSAGSVVSLRSGTPAGFWNSQGFRQLIHAAVGIVLILVVERFPYEWYPRVSRGLLLGAILALGLVAVPGIGVEVNHARRWFRVGPFMVQPSEYAKVIWVVYLSSYLSTKKDRLESFRSGILPSGLVLGVLVFLLLLEPDFGTCALLAGMSFLLWMLGGVPWRHLLTLVPCVAGPLAFLAWKTPYRLERLLAFLDPWTDPLDSGYHLIQSLVAIGSGGIWGVGLGAGRQKLFYLPEPFTDFIVAVVGEELGFVGLALLALAVLFLFWKGIQVARQAPDDFGALLASGLTVLVCFQAWANMAVVMGLLPTKGLAFPFVSYGGSSLTANCIAVGIVLNVARSTGWGA